MADKFEESIYITKPLSPKKDDIFKLWEEVMDSGWFTNMGKQHNLFEKELLEYLKIENISIFNNGTIALIVALKALNLPLGSEVITTPFTFAATPHTISWNGLKPVFADIDLDTMTLSPKAIEKAITLNTSAILPVHVYGFPCDVEAIDKIAKKHNLKVIYDAAHAFTTEIDGRSICDWGNITMLSFHATKLFNSIEGGALVYSDKKFGNKIYELRNFGIKRIETEEDIKQGIKTRDIISDVGINGKMNEFQAAWGRALLNEIKFEQNKLREIANVYVEHLSCMNEIYIPTIPKNISNSYQYFPIIVRQNDKFSRDNLYDELLKNNVYSRKYFYPLCSDFECYKSLPSSNPLNLSVAHKISNNVLCLPFYSNLGIEKAKKICDIVKDIKK